MNEIDLGLSNLKVKVEKLVKQISTNNEIIHRLKEELTVATVTNKRLIEENKMFKRDNNSLKMANDLLGSKKNTTFVKNKINALYRKVDDCITEVENIG